jgi:pimeloyl-ACP methyl ester carboxylesterase
MDIEIHVHDTGEARRGTVLMLHGWPDTGALWRHQAQALAEDGYRVLTPDLRGFGKSGKPQDAARYRARELVGDVTQLLDEKGVERVHLVGHDWGAAISWIAAATRPERVQSLAVLSVGHPASFRKAGIRQREKSWYMLLFQFPGVAEQWLSEDDFRRLRSWSGHPDIEEVVERFRDPTALTASLNLYRAMAAPETLVSRPPALPRIQCPVMGVWSTGDMALIEKQMTGSAEYVDGKWRYEKIEGAGHWMQLDRSDEVTALLRSHLGE